MTVPTEECNKINQGLCAGCKVHIKFLEAMRRDAIAEGWNREEWGEGYLWGKRTEELVAHCPSSARPDMPVASLR